MIRKSFARALPFFIVLGGFVLRLYRLGADSLWYDETVSLLLARSDLAELTRHTAVDIHPPLYYYLLHFWIQLAGISEFATEFFSLCFGVLLIALAYRFAIALSSSPSSASVRDLRSPVVTGERSKRIALLAAFLIAVSPFNIWYSQEVRMYTLGAVLGLASVYFLLRMLRYSAVRWNRTAMENKPAVEVSQLVPPAFKRWQFTRDFFAYVVVTTLGIYTLYYFVFLLVFQYLVVAYFALRMRSEWPARSRPRTLTHPYSAARSLISFIASQFAILLLYLPWLPIAFRQATDPPVPPWRSFIALNDVAVESFSALALGQSVDPAAVAPILILIAALIAFTLVILHPHPQGARLGLLSAIFNPPDATSHRVVSTLRALGAMVASPSSIFLLAYTFVPLLAIFLFSFWKPLYHVRYVFTYSPAFYILLALAVVHAAQWLGAKRKFLQPTFVTLALAVFVFTSVYSLNNFWFDSRYADDDLRGAVAHIADNWLPGDVILVNAGYAYPALLYYYPAPIVRERLVNFQSNASDPTDTALVLQTGSINGSPNLGWSDPRSDFYPTTAEETRAALDRVFRAYSRVWLLRIYDTVTDPGGGIRQYFSEHAQLIDDRGFSGESEARVQGYLTRHLTTLPPTAAPLNVRLADRVALVGWESRNTTRRAGDFYDLVLYWQPLRTLNVNYQSSLQILDANSQLVAQHDETPLGDALPTSRWRLDEIYREPLRVTLPPETAPGAYRFIVKLYNPRDGQVLGDAIELARLNITR